MCLPSLLLRCRSAATLAATTILAVVGFGQPADGLIASSNPPHAVAITLRPGEHVGNEQVIRQFIRIGTNEFVFVLPGEMRRNSTPDGTTVLTSWDMTYFLTVRLKAPPSPPLGLSEALREHIANQYAGASSLEDYTACVADHEGAGFQFWQSLPNVGPRLIRILQVPFRAGVMEFVLNADARNAKTGQAALDMILLTFRSNEHGPLETIQRSDKS